MLLIGCTSPQEGLIGAWRVDLEALRRDPLIAHAAPPAGPLATSWRESSYEGWRFVFYGDARVDVTLRGAVYRGRYEVSQVLGDTVYVRVEATPSSSSALDEELGLKPAGEPLIERLRVRVKRERATLILDDDISLPLRRASGV
jgi:hypothetical protein